MLAGLAARLPDVPRWVETRGMLPSGRCGLVEHMSRHGREPVWGALEDNVPSRQMARALGFEPVDEAVVFEKGASP